MNPWTLFERGTKADALAAADGVLSAADAGAVQAALAAAFDGAPDDRGVLIRGSFTKDDAGGSRLFLDVRTLT